MRRFFAFAFCMALAGYAYANTDGLSAKNIELGTIIDGEYLDGGTLTATVTRSESFTYASLYMAASDGGATAVTMECGETYDATDATIYKIDICDASTFPTLTCSEETRSHALTKGDVWTWHVPVSGYGLQCTFAGTGSLTDDALTVKARGIVR